MDGNMWPCDRHGRHQPDPGLLYCAVLLLHLRYSSDYPATQAVIQVNLPLGVEARSDSGTLRLRQGLNHFKAAFRNPLARGVPRRGDQQGDQHRLHSLY